MSMSRVPRQVGRARRFGSLQNPSTEGRPRRTRDRSGILGLASGLTACVLTATLPDSAAWAQNAPAPAVNVPPAISLVVNSTPSGATVLLHGPYELVGTTPWTITRDLTGVYQLEVRKSGYESWKGEVVVAPGAGSAIDVDLHAKSRLRAFARSLVVPGWGQSYLGNPNRGRTYLALEVLALGGWAYTQAVYQEKVDDFDRAAKNYRNEHRESELPALRRKLNQANDDADTAYDRRQLVAGAVVGVWALSLCDALFLGGGGDASESLTEAGSTDRDLRLVLDPGLNGNEAARVGVALNW